jgi:threonine dehydrogenase-like Zn-dependent dehydrogenase
LKFERHDDLRQSPGPSTPASSCRQFLWDRLPIAKINVKVISLEHAPEAYKSFDAGVANKFVIDPHGQLAKAA